MSIESNELEGRHGVLQKGVRAGVVCWMEAVSDSSEVSADKFFPGSDFLHQRPHVLRPLKSVWLPKSNPYSKAFSYV